MKRETFETYPGSAATCEDLLALAEAYQRGASLLLEGSPSRKHLDRAPFRLCAIHAIELYLSAFLLHNGREPSDLRSFQHDLAKRAVEARTHGLILRRKTFEHLEQLGREREYLQVRYAPDAQDCLSQLNRLDATLQEISRKVTAQLRPLPASA